MVKAGDISLGMLNDNGEPTEHQQRLLNSLQRRVSLDDMPKATLQTKSALKPKLYRSGRGTLDDHMLLIKNYVCQCGHRITDVDHSTASKIDGTALDTYKLKCEHCGDNEEVSFMSMRKALQGVKKEGSFDRSNKRLYPYL